MIPYQSMLLRYLHDPVTGEFANLGVVLFSPGHRVEVRMTESLARASRFFGGIQFQHLRNLLQRLTKALEKTDTGSVQTDFLHTGLQIREITSRALAVDASSLQWADAGSGLTPDLKTAANQQFERLITRYETEHSSTSRSSGDVWKSYEKHLARTKTLAKLAPHKLASQDYQHQFDHTWANGCLRVIEPVSLDYDNPDYIVERGRHWLGVGIALQDAAEAHQFTFLLGLPKTSKAQKAADKARNLMSKIDSSVRFVAENDAKHFANELEQEIGAQLHKSA